MSRRKVRRSTNVMDSVGCNAWTYWQGTHGYGLCESERPAESPQNVASRKTEALTSELGSGSDGATASADAARILTTERPPPRYSSDNAADGCRLCCCGLPAAERPTDRVA